MSLANEQSAPGFADNEAIDANVRKVVQAFLLIRDMEPEELAEALTLGRSAIYTRLSEGKNKTRFTVAEIYRMSRLFGVPVGTFYEPPELATSGYKSQVPGEAPVLTVIDGSRKDSQRPTARQFYPAPVPDLAPSESD